MEEENQEEYRLRKRWRVEYNETSDGEDEEKEEEEEENRKTWKTEGIQFLPVICGTTEGILDCEKLEQRKGSSKKWKSTILYENQPLEYWIKKGYLKTEGYRKGRSKTRKEIQSSGSEETEDDNAEERTTKHTISAAAEHALRGKEIKTANGTGAYHPEGMDHPGECSSSAKVNTTTAAATLITPSNKYDLSINGSDGEGSEDQLTQSSERKEQEASTSLGIVNKTESSVLNSDARMEDREDGHLTHCGDEKEQNREDPLDMLRSEVTGNTRDVATQTVPKGLLKAKIQPAEEAGGDIVEDKDQFLSRGQLAVKTEQRAEEKVGSGHENEVVNSEDAGNEEEEDEMETGGMESEAVPAVASNHTNKCVIKEGSAERGDAQSANCGNEKEGDDPPNMPKSEVTVKTRDVERNTPIKQQNVEEKTEEEMSPSCEPLAASDECEHKDVHCSVHNVAALQSTRPERSSSPATQTSVGINFSHMSEALSPGPSVSSGLNTTDLDQLKREKLKMQLKVLKLQEECYTLIIKELKK